MRRPRSGAERLGVGESPPRWARWVVMESYRGESRSLSWHMSKWGAQLRLAHWEHWCAQFDPVTTRYFAWYVRRI